MIEETEGDIDEHNIDGAILLIRAARAGKSSVKRVVFVWMVRQPG